MVVLNDTTMYRNEDEPKAKRQKIIKELTRERRRKLNIKSLRIKDKIWYSTVFDTRHVPDDILKYILSFTPERDYHAVLTTSKRFNSLGKLSLDFRAWIEPIFLGGGDATIIKRIIESGRLPDVEHNKVLGTIVTTALRDNIPLDEIRQDVLVEMILSSKSAKSTLMSIFHEICRDETREDVALLVARLLVDDRNKMLIVKLNDGRGSKKTKNLLDVHDVMLNYSETIHEKIIIDAVLKCPIEEMDFRSRIRLLMYFCGEKTEATPIIVGKCISSTDREYADSYSDPKYVLMNKLLQKSASRGDTVMISALVDNWVNLGPFLDNMAKAVCLMRPGDTAEPSKTLDLVFSVVSSQDLEHVFDTQKLLKLAISWDDGDLLATILHSTCCNHVLDSNELLKQAVHSNKPKSLEFLVNNLDMSFVDEDIIRRVIDNGKDKLLRLLLYNPVLRGHALKTKWAVQAIGSLCEDTVAMVTNLITLDGFPLEECTLVLVIFCRAFDYPDLAMYILKRMGITETEEYFECIKHAVDHVSLNYHGILSIYGQLLMEAHYKLKRRGLV